MDWFNGTNCQLNMNKMLFACIKPQSIITLQMAIIVCILWQKWIEFIIFYLDDANSVNTHCHSIDTEYNLIMNGSCVCASIDANVDVTLNKKEIQKKEQREKER